ncbi:MAG TPA: hypothetical protein VGJ21_08950 [Terracidiphilus sp.]|jgi:hypothetical protein
MNQVLSTVRTAGAGALFILAAYIAACGGGSVVSPAPPVTPPAYVAPLPWIYSQVFSSSSPFHTTVASLKGSGATVLPQSAMISLWNQGVANQGLSTTSYMFPVNVSTASDPVKTFLCGNQYAVCVANGMQIHIPAGAVPEPQSDGHIGILDTTLKMEVDGWACATTDTQISCAWGGKWPFGGNGIENAGEGSVKAGYASGLFEITAQELMDGEIDHALGINTQCLNNPTVYPADQNADGTDQSCGGTGAPSYGDLVHLTWTPGQIASSPYSPECKVVLTALATYGAYTFDTGNGGLALLTQHQLSYTSIGKTSPWATKILPDLAAAGDGDGTNWRSCLNRVKASDFELLQIKPGAY